MKHTIYIIAIAILILTSLAVVLLYYTQDFSEDLDFVNAINYADIELETNEFRNQEKYLISAKSVIGDLTLKNNGYFTQVYNLPQIIGCINIKKGVDKDSLLLRNTRFFTEFSAEGATFSNDRYSYSGDKQIKIEVGEKKSFKISGVYRPNNVPLSQFSREIISSVSLYRIPEKQTNPLSNSYKYGNLRYSNDCTSIEPDLEPIATININ